MSHSTIIYNLKVLSDLKESPSLEESSQVTFSQKAKYSKQQPKAIEDKVCLHQSWSLCVEC